MSRYLIIERKPTQVAKYMGKMFNVWLDSNVSAAPSAKLASGKTVKLKIDEKEHRLIINRVGLLFGDVQFYTVPKGTDDVALQVDVNASGVLSIRKKSGKKTSGSKAGAKAGGSKGGTKSKTPVKTTRDFYVIRGAAEGSQPNVPIRMAMDYMSKQPVVYEFKPNMEYTITTDKKKHELVFFYPDVQTGDLVLRTLEAGSQDEAFYVDFDVNGVLVAVKTDVPKKNKAEGADIAVSPTTAGVKEYIGFQLDPAKGSPVPVLLRALNTCEYLRVSVGSDAVNFLMHYEDDKEDHPVVSCPYETVNKKIAGAAGTFTSLNTLSQRNQLLTAIREFVNKECPGVSMKGTKIYPDQGSTVKPATKGKKTTTPDLSESLTCTAMVADVMTYFNEKSEFAADLDKVAKTCLLSVEEDRVKVTIMVEDFETAQALPDAGTQVKEFLYSEADTAPYFEYNFNLTQSALDNQFDILVREEDRQILMEKILDNLSNMPHLIVEGNTFRSRRKGEELIDVEHTLTAAAMKHKVMKLFTSESKLVDVLRHSNVNYCQISPGEKDISFAYIDMDTEICEIIKYTFEELVGPELLEGEDCFGQLRYGHEMDTLAGVIGKELCTLPYLKPCYDPELEPGLGWYYYAQFTLDPDVISKVSDVYETPAWISGVQEDPEEPEIPDTPDIPAKSTLADSPTTAALVAQLTEYFKEGSMFDQMLKTGMYDQITFNAGGSDAALGFLKKAADESLNVCGNMALDYAFFGAGQEGSFTELDMDQQDELEEIIWNTFPFLKN